MHLIKTDCQASDCFILEGALETIIKNKDHLIIISETYIDEIKYGTTHLIPICKKILNKFLNMGFKMFKPI